MLWGTVQHLCSFAVPLWIDFLIEQLVCQVIAVNYRTWHNRRDGHPRSGKS